MSYIKENLKIARLHFKRLKKAKDEIVKEGLIEKLRDEDFETVKVVNAFVFGFIKLQDYMKNKLFKNFLKAVGEESKGLRFVDTLDKLKKLKIINPLIF